MKKYFEYWCAYQIAAMKLKCWKYRYLLYGWSILWVNLERYLNTHLDSRYEDLYDMNHIKEIDPTDIIIKWEAEKILDPSLPDAKNQYLNLREQLTPMSRLIFTTAFTKLGLL